MNTKRIGFFAGSFDPFTTGHLQVVNKALTLFDELIIGIAHNPEKKRRFDVDLMEQAIKETIEAEGLSSRCTVVSYVEPKLTCRQAREMGATHLVRGLRDNMDYGAEEKLAKGNKKIGDYETVYVRSDTEIDSISSTIVMAAWLDHFDVSEYLPKPVLEAMETVRKNS